MLKEEINMVFQTEISPFSVGNGELNQSLVSFDKQESQDVHEHIEHYQQDESGKITLTLDKEEDKLSQLEQSDIFVLSPTNEYPFGFIGKVEKMNESSKKTELILSQPSVEEVFSNLDIDMNRNLSPQDLVATNAIEGVSVVYETKEEKTASRKGLKKASEESLHLSPKGKFGIKIDKLVVYDHDKDLQKNEREKNTKGQIILSGEYMLQDPALEVVYKYKKRLGIPFIERMMTKVTGNIHNELKFNSDLYKQEFGLGASVKKNDNKIDKWGFTLEGVKPDKKKITVASATISQDPFLSP